MTNIKEQEFNNIVGDILNNKKFKDLNKELHHGIARYEHSLRVAKMTYKFTSFFKMKNMEKTTRAALLHDFYTNEDLKDASKTEKLSLHPSVACENAQKYYELSPMEENIIKSHMFPLKGETPKYKESVVVSLMDKSVATYEMFRFKFSMVLTIWILFLFNIITIQK